MAAPIGNQYAAGNPGGGRPPDYKPEYAKLAKKACSIGYTDRDLAELFEVNERSIRRWKLEHEEFLAALKVGKEPADDSVERSLYERAKGYIVVEQQAIKVKCGPHEERVEVVELEKQVPPDTTACIFWLKNRRKDNWRDKPDGEVSDETAEVLKRLIDKLPG